MQPPNQDSRDSSPSPPSSIDIRRITPPELFGFLGRLSIGSYLVLAGVIGGIFSFGVFVNGLRNDSGETQRLDLEKKTIQQAEELNLSKFDLQRRSIEIDQLKKEKLELQDKNVGLAKTLDVKKQKILTLIGDIEDLELQLVNRKFQRDFADRSQNVTYVIWVPESASLPPIYIDDKHYALFKCLRKIFPGDLLDNKGTTKASSFSIRFEKTTLPDVPHLYIVSLPHGAHRITRQASSTLHPIYEESTEKFEVNSIHLINIDQIDVYRNDKGVQTKLRTLDYFQLIRAIPSKVFDSMRWPPLIGQNVLFLKWRLAVFCLRGGEPCGQVVHIHAIRRVSVKRPVRPDLVVEDQVALQALLGCADGLVGV